MKRSLPRSVSPAVLGAALLVAVLVAVLVGCSDGSGDDSTNGSGGSMAEMPALAQDGPARHSMLAPELADTASLSRIVEQAPDLKPRALIRNGNISLRADDVGAAGAEVQQVADRYAGQVSSEKTQSDDDGRPTYARMVLRIPSDDFSKAVAALKQVGELESASTKEDDVTDEVIDVRTRLRVQERSIARITVLFDRAQSIRDIMAIEAQLSRRQADLESLQRRADYLADQTSLSTIVVSIDRTPQASASDQDDDSGFVAGLGAGWDALTTFAIGAATAAGAALPLAVVLLVVGLPVLLLVRTLRRRTTPPAAPAETQSSE